jgi:hypothetical protein
MQSSAVRGAALVTIVFAAWQALTAQPAVRDVASDQITQMLAAYRKLPTYLPAAGEIGFVATTGDPTFDSANYYVAQYALAPRVVVLPIGPHVRFVITGVNAPPGIDRTPALQGFELVALRDMGVRVFRRAGP